jgi:polar amino acid transport system ATP-binding protein
MTQEIIRFQNVVKRFGALTVLDQFNFSVTTGLPAQVNLPCFAY